MKKSLGMATVALMGALTMTGCVSNKGGNPVAEWQAERLFSAEIADINAKAKPLSVADVTYKSTLTDEALAAPINAVATVAAGLYQQVVTGVDKMAAEQDGRLIYLGVQNDVKAGAKVADLVAQMTSEEKAAYDTYAASVKQTDQTSVMNTVVTPLLTQLATESAKVAATVAAVRENPTFRALAGLELMAASKDLAADGNALTQQFDDATAGANLWMELLQKDREAKQFMQDYPIE